MDICSTQPRFDDRRAAGRALADRLAPKAAGRSDDFVVVGITDGGAPVAAEVADRLGLALDVVVVQRVHRADRVWQTLGALAEQGALALAPGLPDPGRVGPNELEKAVHVQRTRLRHRVQRIRNGRGPLSCRGRTVLLVDDGLTDGTNVRAASAALRARGALRIVLAVPVATRAGVAAVTNAVERVICLQLLDPPALGRGYARFDQVEDEQVRDLLTGTGRSVTACASPGNQVQEVSFSVARRTVHGLLSRPDGGADGLVVIARLAAGQRTSARSRTVAEAVNRVGLAALTLDLLTEDEQSRPGQSHRCVDLARRLNQVTRQAGRNVTRTAMVGFGRGAAVVLEASAAEPGAHAAVCIDGDFTWLGAPGRVTGPVLLLARADEAAATRSAGVLTGLRCRAELETTPGADLGATAARAAEWLRTQAFPRETHRVELTPDTAPNRSTTPLAPV